MKIDLFSITVLAIVGGGFLYAFFWILKVKRNGIEAEAYVSRIEEHETIDSDGMPMRTED